MNEELEQMAFVDWLNINHIPHFHCPNEVGGQTRSLKVRAVKMKRMGVSKGVPDLFVFIPVYGTTGEADCYQMCVVEMKRKNNSRVSVEQKEWLKILEASGAVCSVCKGAAKAIEFVEMVRKEINAN